MATQPTEEKTLAQARQELRADLYTGTKCPCCTQFAKVYKRQIHSSMSRMLISLYHLGPGYHHVNDIPSVRNGYGDFAKLVYWKLIAEMTDPGLKAGRTTGYWMITEKGRAFVERGVYVPKYAEVYNGHLIKLSGPETFVDNTLGKAFNYQELMR